MIKHDAWLKRTCYSNWSAWWAGGLTGPAPRWAHRRREAAGQGRPWGAPRRGHSTSVKGTPPPGPYSWWPFSTVLAEGTGPAITHTHRKVRTWKGKFTSIESECEKGGLPLQSLNNNRFYLYSAFTKSQRCWQRIKKTKQMTKHGYGRINASSKQRFLSWFWNLRHTDRWMALGREFQIRRAKWENAQPP